MKNKNLERSNISHKMRISLPIVVQVRGRVCASSSPAGHQYDFTLSYPVSMK